MRHFSILVKIGKIIQKCPLWLLQFIEIPFLRKIKNKIQPTPALIIFALPRSGSTVIFQTICHALNVNYLSNLWNVFYQIPLIGGMLSYCAFKKYRSNFKSQNGFVTGLGGQAEGMRFWRWWLDCGLEDSDCHCITPRLREKRVNYLRRILILLGDITQTPFATAYIGHILVPDRVSNAFPGSILIRVRRDLAYNALSLLRAMQNSGQQWFSVRPDECKRQEITTPHEQVASQVYWLNRRLDEACCADSMVSIKYEDLCNNPQKVINKLQEYCALKGLIVSKKYKLPASLDKKKLKSSDKNDLIKIRVALSKLENKFGALK